VRRQASPQFEERWHCRWAMVPISPIMACRSSVPTPGLHSTAIRGLGHRRRAGFIRRTMPHGVRTPFLGSGPAPRCQRIPPLSRPEWSPLGAASQALSYAGPRRNLRFNKFLRPATATPKTEFPRPAVATGRRLRKRRELGVKSGVTPSQRRRRSWWPRLLTGIADSNRFRLTLW
jgi:hypothetical protein